MARETWIKRGQARARALRDAYREAQERRAARPPAEPPVETDADLDDEGPDAGAAGPAEQLALEGVGRAGPPRAAPVEAADPEAEPEEAPPPPEISEHQQELPPAPAVGFGERIADVGHEARGALSDGGHWASERWRALPQVARHRVAAGAILAAALALFVLVLIPAAPCGFPGGDSCPPPDDAIDVVPDEAIAYAHLDIDPDGEQYEAAAALVARLPLLGGFALEPLGAIAGRPADLGADVRPWAGEEAALAVVPEGAGTATAVLIEAEDEEAARRFADDVIGQSPSRSDAGGTEVAVGSRGRAYAEVSGFLVLGDEEAVRTIADPPEGSGDLADSEAGDAIDRLPEDRLAYAWLSAPGARALMSTRALRPLDTFVDSSATAGVAAALTVDGDVIRATVRSDLDPERAGSAPGVFAALPLFEPTLASDVGPDALAYVGVGEPGNSIQALLSQASTEAPALRRAYVQAAQQLRKRGGISFASDLLPLLGTQVALSVEPVTASAPETPGVAASSGVPYLSLLAEGVDSEAAAADLAQLQRPLTEALVPKSGVVGGRVSAFESVQIAGTEAQSLAVSRNVELTYATYDDRLAVSTDPLGIAQARAAGDGLADTDSYGQVTEGFPDELSLIAYLDLRGLIALGEQVGLATDPAYAPLAPDLRALDGAAVAVTGREGEIRTDAALSLAEPEAVEVESSPLPGD